MTRSTKPTQSPRNDPPTNPVKAIRKKCLECSVGSNEEVAKCPVEDCYLWPFRFGKNPYRTRRVMTEEQKEAARVRGREMYEKNLAAKKT